MNTENLKAAIGVMTLYAERPGDVDPDAMMTEVRAQTEAGENLEDGLASLCVVLLTLLAKEKNATELEVMQAIAEQAAGES